MKLTLMCEEVLEGLWKIPRDTIDVIFTSPPYYNLKDYQGGYAPWESYEKYLESNQQWFLACYRVLKPGGWLFWNVQSSIPNKTKDGINNYPLSADISILGRQWFQNRGECIWLKNTSHQLMFGSYPKPTNPCFIFCHENILCFKKIGKRKSNKIISKEVWFNKIRTTFILAAEKSSKIGHPAPFPVELPKRFLELTTDENSTVLDIFVGSGSTGIACQQLGVKEFIGIDISQQYINLAQHRIGEEIDMAKDITPLVWMGGKSKQWHLIKKYIPKMHFDMFMDVFLGGGSVLLNAMRDNLADVYLGNDINQELIDFYKGLQEASTEDLKKIRIPQTLEEAAVDYLDNVPEWLKYFYEINLTFNGIGRQFTEPKLVSNFNQRKWDKLYSASDELKKHGVLFYNTDYWKFFEGLENIVQHFPQIFVFLDPPYSYNSKRDLYKGHSEIDFSELLNFCRWLTNHNILFLMTIDNSPNIRELFKEYAMSDEEWSYTATNNNGKDCKVGKELFIRNYENNL